MRNIKFERNTKQVIVQPVKPRKIQKSTQAYVSLGVRYFKQMFMQKFGFEQYTDRYKPLVMFGFYKKDALSIIKNHKAPLILIFAGTDANRILNLKRSMLIRGYAHGIKVYAISNHISNSFKKFKIKHQILPLTPTTIKLNPEPLGDKLYCYVGRDDKMYGKSLALEVQRRTGIQVLFTGKDNVLSKQEIIQAYRDSFMGLRFTKRDGLPNTVAELGMMGRRCICNNILPNCIPWNNINDICSNVLKQYQKRNDIDVQRVSKQVKQFLDIGQDWKYI